jgi:cytoskeleton protein RodZ
MDVGTQLRDAREARGLTIDAVSKSTRVQPRILSAIEQNDCAALPPRPYGRGFVRTFAAEVGLDPDATVRDFFSQFAPPEEPPPAVDAPPPLPERPHPSRSTSSSGRWLWPIGAVLGYAAIGALVIVAGQWLMAKAVAPGGAVGTTGSSVPSPAASMERRPAPAPAAPAAVVDVALQADRPAWVTAVVDGQRTVYRTLQPGERVTLRGMREVSIRTGDAGALTWQVNNRAIGPMGQPGEVRTARVTPENAAAVK